MLNILFPKYCPGCGYTLDQPRILICINCRNALPLTQYHINNNPRIIDKFYGILPLDQGTALLHYHKQGLAQKIIHALKYRGNKELGQLMGQWLGHELKSTKSYGTLSAVVPVPMHPEKLSRRGYNQAAIFGRCLAQAMDIPFLEKLLIQTQVRHTQAKQGRWERWSEKQSFALNPQYSVFMKSLKFASQNHSTPENSEGRLKLLLVDDVITTGATIEACGRVLINELEASLSCASIAIA